jgi:hypothetical protein
VTVVGHTPEGSTYKHRHPRRSRQHGPGLTAGTSWSHGECVLWDARHSAKAIAVRLQGEPYERLMVEVDDPEAALDRLHALPADDDPAAVPPPRRWTTLAPLPLALAAGVLIAIRITLIELPG